MELKEGDEVINSPMEEDGDKDDDDEREEGEVRPGAKTPPNPGPPKVQKKEFDLDAYLQNKCQFCEFVAK